MRTPKTHGILNIEYKLSNTDDVPALMSIASFFVALLVKQAKKLSAGDLHSTGARGKNEGSLGSAWMLLVDMALLEC